MKKFLSIFLMIGFLTGSFPSSGYCDTIQQILEGTSPVADSSGINANPDADGIPTVEAEKSRPENGFAIQIGTFFSQSAADQKIIELHEKGLDPYIFEAVNSKNQAIYSVRIGKFNSYPEAAARLSQVQDRLNQPAMITDFNSLDPATPADTRSTGRTPPAAEAEKSIETEADQAETAADHMQQPGEPATIEALQERLRFLETEITKLKEETDVRESLRVSEEEAREAEEDILEAAGAEYTLTKAGNLKFTYGFTYTYDEYDAIRAMTKIEDVSNHTLSNSFNVSFGLKDNLTLGTGIPFVYKYHQVGTIYEDEVTDFGDLSLNWKFQPIKSTSDFPTIIAFGGFRIPVGRSPYEIQYGNELSTSSGIYSTNLGISVSQTSDPVVVFGSLNVNYPFSTVEINQKRPEGILDEVDPGAGIGIGVGMAYALSYKLNLNMSFGYSYAFETEYRYKDAPTAESSTSASANLDIGVGYRFSRVQNMNFTIGIPLTESGQFSFSFSTPIEFEL